MDGDDFIQVSYTTLKSEFALKPLKMYYTETFDSGGINAVSYEIYAVCTAYGLTCTILSTADIANFETNFKASSIAVVNGDEAAALSMLPILSTPFLTNSQAGRAYGYTATAAAASKTVTATTYTAPGNNVGRSIVSASANDTAAGTGARTVKITYLDATGAGPFTETVTLNGLTAVNTVGTNIALIERMDVMTVGSGGGNAGTINLMTGLAGAGSVIGSIATGDNQTNWAHHYVPVGKTCYVVLMEGSATVAAGGLSVNSLNPINGNVAQVQPDTTIRHGTTHISRPLQVPVQIVGPALIFINERPDVATASTVFVGFQWIQQ